MPFNESTTATRKALPKPEFLSYPLETTVIDSVVVLSADVDADTSGPYEGRRYLLAGTVLVDNGDGTYQALADPGTETIAGVLFDTVEFASDQDSSNEPVAMVRRNCSLDSAKIVDFGTHQTELEAWGDDNNVEFI